MKVTFYTKENCSLCDLAREMIEDLREDSSFELETVDITESPEDFDTYRDMIPVIQVGDGVLWGRIDESELRNIIGKKVEGCSTLSG